MEVREVLVGLNLIEGIGSRRVKKLLEFFGKPQEIAQASCERLYQAAGINRKTAQAIRSLRPRDVEGECRQAARRGLRIMTLVDEDYPALLKTIYDPPAVLYVKGSLNAEDERALALVGSRRASFYGRRQAGQFAGALSRYGFTIVSGLARGIDCCAHRGALASGGRTIAVMGSGFLHLYPAEHRELAEQISRQGAVITEYPLHTKPLPYYFPRRNRIISGLSWGVLVVEAARTSGALITADTALEQGREVFAIPGKIDSATSDGTNALIRQGARIVLCVEDIVEEFDGVHSCSQEQSVNVPRQRRQAALSPEESRLEELLRQEPHAMDELVEASGMGCAELSGILLQLQLKKCLTYKKGLYFYEKNG